MKETQAEKEGLLRLSADLQEAARRLTQSEARYLVDMYYTIQEWRIRMAAQIRAATEQGEPNVLLEWCLASAERLEGEIKKALDKYSANSLIGEWLRSVKGIGPVLAAGLLAHIDIHKAPTVGHIWSFAGLNPEQAWKKGEKRPWNAALKTLCWKVGESFVKVSGNQDAIYGRIYAERKALETERNEAGTFADQAARKLELHECHCKICAARREKGGE